MRTCCDRQRRAHGQQQRQSQTLIAFQQRHHQNLMMLMHDLAGPASHVLAIDDIDPALGSYQEREGKCQPAPTSL